MSAEDFAKVAEPFIRQAVKNPAIDPSAIAALLQQRTEVLTDIAPKLDFFDELPEYDAELFVHQKSKSTLESAKTVLEQIVPMFAEITEWKDEEILSAMTKLTETMGVKKSVVMWPVRIGAAGKAVTPGGAVEICRILGKDETLRRLGVALKKACLRCRTSALTMQARSGMPTLSSSPVAEDAFAQAQRIAQAAVCQGRPPLPCGVCSACKKYQPVFTRMSL